MVLARKPIPFAFVLDELERLSPYTKPMFGCTSVYVDEKIVLILREKEEHVEDNGIWLATTAEHHETLQKDFPSMRSIKIFGPGPTGWQVLPLDANDFEESALRACQFILNGDHRIGKIPKRKKISKKTRTTARARRGASRTRRTP